MRVVTLFIATSADGMIARESGEIEWLVNSDIYDYDAFYAQVDTLLMGRKTFECIQKKGPWPYHGKKTYVFSRALHLSNQTEIQVVRRDPAAFVEELKEFQGGRIWLVGGAELARALMREDLVDEVLLSISPEIVGTGVHLYPLPLHSMFWELKESKELPDGMVHVRYVLKGRDIPID